MESIKQHPTEEVLEQYLFGLLSDNEAGPVEEHLLVCHACIDTAEQLLAFVQSLRGSLQAKVRAAGRSTLMENEV